MNKYDDHTQMYLPLTGIPPLRNTNKQTAVPPHNFNAELSNPPRETFFSRMYDYFETCINNACERLDDLINNHKEAKVTQYSYPTIQTTSVKK